MCHLVASLALNEPEENFGFFHAYLMSSMDQAQTGAEIGKGKKSLLVFLINICPESRFPEEPRNWVPRKIFMKNRKKSYLSYEMLHFG